MIKARNKKLSMLLVLAMLMTMFVGVGTASAASIEYDPINTPSYSTSTTPQSVDAQVLIDVDDAIVFANKTSIVTVKLPSNVEFVVGSSKVYLTEVVDKADLTATADIKSSGAADLYVVAGAVSGGMKLLLTFEGLVVKSGSGDLNVTMLAPSGSAFPSGSITIAKISGKGSVQLMAGNKATFGDNGGYIDGITIAEASAGTLEEGDEITFKLPKGFKWDDNFIAIGGGWGFDGYSNFHDDSGNDFDFWTDENGRELVVKIYNLPGTTQAGRITVGTDGFGLLPSDQWYPYIIVEDNAKFGDITVDVSSTNDKGPDGEIVVATYGDYGVKVVEGTSEEVYAGRTEQELGKFYIEEGIAASLIADRTIYLELPKGVKWVEYPTVDVEDGDLIIDDSEWVEVSNSSDRKIKITVDDFSAEASKLVFKKMEVKIAPSFEGPLDITVSGNAGAEGTVTVAECIKPITVKAENPTKVEIGAMNQKAGDILIIENIAEGIFDGEYNRIEITLPRGIYFASEPKVEVEEGDLEIDDVDLEDSAFNKDGALVITIDYASSKKSIIRISDVFLTVDRTVPEGKVLAKFEGALSYGFEEYDNEVEYIKAILNDESVGSTAFVNWATDESIGSVEIATTITPSQGGYAKFVIGSNIYEVGAVPYVMDAVPYIKDSRSYVPMRYLAQMLGAEVTWEQADQTVTLSNGEVTAVFTIGST
ncbi:MAG: copper amine oxidase N-terminal domain-containing protein, partial [Syntrophomonadaceae bacterium]|nr:copper amine oxidase N-terminal domain-containing protein [Syntrophomonadaceae bacterium]